MIGCWRGGRASKTAGFDSGRRTSGLLLGCQKVSLARGRIPVELFGMPSTECVGAQAFERSHVQVTGILWIAFFIINFNVVMMIAVAFHSA